MERVIGGRRHVTTKQTRGVFVYVGCDQDGLYNLWL